MRKTVSKTRQSLPTQHAPKGTYKYTSKIEFLGRGKSENGDRFIKRRIGEDVALISVAKLFAQPNDEFVRLQRAGVTLLLPDARREFTKRVQDEAGKQPTFQVATQPGLLGGKFHFPDDGVSKGVSGAEFYPDERHANVYRKFHRAGTRQGWMNLCALSRGKSRLVLGYALASCGPICAAFGFEPPGVQFVGVPGSGKSTAAKIPSAMWGWDLTPGALFGFGSSWQATPAALENIAAACNHTLLFLDEMSQASAKGVESIMMIAQGQGTARYTELHRQTWCEPLLSTSNKSVVAIMSELGFAFDAAYVDRLMDIPSPAGSGCFFEDLHGFVDLAAYEARLRELAENNHGWAGRVLAEQFTRALGSDRGELKGFVVARRDGYKRAAGNIAARKRDLVRVHGRFATIYAAGCVTIRFGILPFTEAELLAAVLKCERAHVAFIDQELGIAAAPAKSPSAVTAPAATIAAAQQPFDLLKKFINAGGFVDLREDDPILPLAEEPIGYVGEHDRRKEYWLTNRQFEAVAGGKREGQQLKAQLVKVGLLATEQRGAGLGLVVKRPIPGVNNRARVVAIRHAPQKQAKPLQAERQSASQ